MDLTSLPPAILVDDAEGLERLVEDLEGETEIAFDTEADSFFSYKEKVCLIQITVGDRDYILDPLCGLDLSPIGEVLADPARVKVFHDGEYDVLILKNDFGFEFANLYDTRVAAAALGNESPGLAAVLLEHFDVELDKSMQRSDWGRRPLSDEQLAYARLDTRFLIPLKNRLHEELVDRDRVMVLDGECRRIEALVPPDTVFRPDDFVRIKGARNLEPLDRQVLRELFVARDEIASADNVPLFRIINNQTLVNLAIAKPRNGAQLVKVHGFSQRQARKFGDRVLEAVELGREKGPLNKLPKLPPKDGTGGLSDEQYELHERLKAWRKERAADAGFDASLLMNRHVLLRIALEQPKSKSEIAAIDGICDWQVERYADSLERLLSKFERQLAKGEIELSRRRKRPR